MIANLGVKSFKAVSMVSVVASVDCGSSLEAFGLNRGTASSSSSSSSGFVSDTGLVASAAWQNVK